MSTRPDPGAEAPRVALDRLDPETGEELPTEEESDDDQS